VIAGATAPASSRRFLIWAPFLAIVYSLREFFLVGS